MKRLNDTSFDQALRETAGTLIVKFYADWCPDCRRIERGYEGFPTQFPSLSFAEINTEESPEVAGRLDVKGIPSFLVFRDGGLVRRLYSRDAKSIGQVVDFVASQVE
ncbi:MAG: thioredoxin family protein [Symbiobacteriia bacterium]